MGPPVCCVLDLPLLSGDLLAFGYGNGVDEEGGDVYAARYNRSKEQVSTSSTTAGDLRAVLGVHAKYLLALALNVFDDLAEARCCWGTHRACGEEYSVQLLRQ